MTSTSSPIRPLDPASPVTLHEQAAAQIRRAIAEGQASPGERLPPAGDLAAVLGGNRNTVLRALRLLREEGVVEFRRGRGITVTAAPQATALVTAARDLLAQARRHGYDRDDLIRLVQALPDP
jgi:GntR family transcriptional regulator